MRSLTIALFGLSLFACGEEGGGGTTAEDAASGFTETDARDEADGTGSTGGTAGQADDGVTPAPGDAAPVDPVPDTGVTPTDATTPTADGETPTGDAGDEPDAGTGCAPERPCEAGLRCNLATGECVPEGICLEDAECPGSRSCENGTCPEANPCQGPDDCDGERICNEGACADRCGAANPCPGRQVCSDELGVCQEPEDGCMESADCPGRRECRNGECVIGCVENADCPGSRTCNVETGECPEAAVCFGAADCDLGRVCASNACAPSCDAGGGCAGNLVCDQAVMACVPPPAPGDACAVDVDCGAELICEAAVCSAAECSVDGECGDDVCLARRCEPNPRECDAQRPCGLGLECSAEGACLLEGACQSDDDCFAGIDHCEVESGLCRACVDDGHCGAGEACVDFACVAGADCAGDDDCPGTQICTDGACGPGPCAGDVHDVAPEPVGLEQRLHANLVLCDGDTDIYDVGILADSALQIILRHDRNVGNLALNVRDLGDPTDFAGTTRDGATGVEDFILGASPNLRSARVTVTGTAGISVPYTLEILTPGPNACSPDAFEGATDNDVEARAAALGAGPTNLSICPDDVDFFEVNLLEGVEVTVEAAGERAVADFTLSVIDPEGAPLAEGETAGESCICFTPPGEAEQCNCTPDDGTRLRATATVAAAGRHLIRVAGQTPDVMGDLALTVTSAGGAGPEAVACQNAVLLSPDVPLVLQPTALFNVFRATCGFGMGSDYVARFDLAARSTVTVAAVDSGFLTALAIRTDCDDIGTETECASGANATISDVSLAAGTYYVVLKSGGGQSPELHLSVR